MKRGILKFIKFVVLTLVLFGFFWFANSGFDSDSWRSLVVAVTLTIVVCLMILVKISNIFWFWLILTLFVLSTLFEILKIFGVADIFASTGFGILLIFVIFSFVRLYRR